MINHKYIKEKQEYVNNLISLYIKEKHNENKVVNIKELRDLKKIWEKEFELKQIYEHF